MTALKAIHSTSSIPRNGVSSLFKLFTTSHSKSTSNDSDPARLREFLHGKCKSGESSIGTTRGMSGCSRFYHCRNYSFSDASQSFVGHGKEEVKEGITCRGLEDHSKYVITGGIQTGPKVCMRR